MLPGHFYGVGGALHASQIASRAQRRLELDAELLGGRKCGRAKVNDRPQRHRGRFAVRSFPCPQKGAVHQSAGQNSFIDLKDDHIDERIVLFGYCLEAESEHQPERHLPPVNRARCRRGLRGLLLGFETSHAQHRHQDNTKDRSAGDLF